MVRLRFRRNVPETVKKGHNAEAIIKVKIIIIEVIF